MAKDDWIKSAINPKDKGDFRRAAERHHMSTKAFATKVIRELKGKSHGDPAKLKLLRQAVLARTLMKYDK